jgi:kynureninase
VRLLSALPLRQRPRLVTTDAEFHTIRRQLQRLEEEGLEVVRVPATPHLGLAERLSDAVDDRTCLVLVSSVLYTTGRMVFGLDRVLDTCRFHGAELLIDAYHHLNVVPFSLKGMRLNGAFVVGGGYKYCQLGEGNAFLRFPRDRRLRPAVTGWFAEFDLLEQAVRSDQVGYGSGPGRMAGSTYDPTSHYRAAEVFAFFGRLGLEPGFLRKVSQHQIGLLAAEFDDLGLDPGLIRRPEVPLVQIAGFLVLETDRAAELTRRLRRRGVFVDSRGHHLRLGPAPYLDDEQLRETIALLGEEVTALSSE